MGRVENSSLWAALILAGLLGGCAAPPSTQDAAATEPTKAEAADTSATAAGDTAAAEAAASEAAPTGTDEAGEAAPAAVEEAAPVERASLAELAEARGEIDTAMLEIRMAEARDLPQPEARAKVEQARQALDAGDAARAGELAREAGAQARRALDGYYADMARQRIDVLRKDYSDKMSSAQRMRLDAAESALKAGQAEVALMLVNALVKEVAPNAVFESPRSDGKLSKVRVREGDTLSDIAARPEVYGNADLWPLLLKANREKFLRVDEVPVGVELVIPRNVTAEEIEEALAQAR